MAQRTSPAGPIERARVAAGYSRAEVATSVCRSPESVARWERGETMPPQAVMLRLCRMFNVPPTDLVA